MGDFSHFWLPARTPTRPDGGSENGIGWNLHDAPDDYHAHLQGLTNVLAAETYHGRMQCIVCRPDSVPSRRPDRSPSQIVELLSRGMDVAPG